MALKIDEFRSGDVMILRLEGRITLGEETNSLREAIRRLVETGHTKILLNLERVSYLDSAGLGTLVAAHSSVRSHGGVLKLAGISARAPIHDLLRITRLFTVFDISENEDDALGGDWSGPRAI